MNIFTIIKNASANVFRIGVSALVALLLPPLLARTLSGNVYNTWALIIQLSVYVGFLDFGVQTAVGRFVAYVGERGNTQERNQIISTAFVLLLGSSCLAFVFIIFLAWQLPNLFHAIPGFLQKDARIALLLVGGSLALGLPASVFIGAFIGLQRNEVPVVIIVGSKLLGAILTALVVYMQGSMVLMATVMAFSNLVSYIIQGILAYCLIENLQISRHFVSFQEGKRIALYCLGLSVWSFGMLLVSGLDTAVVGLFDFSSVANYTIANTLINFIIQLQSAIFSVFIPTAAVLSIHNNAEWLGKLLVSLTRYGIFILIVMGMPLIIGAEFILSVWVGSAYAENTTILLQILVIANIIRLSGLPYTTLLIGANQQHLVILSPLVEGVANLIVSIIAAIFWGAVGVAIGTLVGAIIGISFHVYYNIPRTIAIAVTREDYIFEGVLRPCICAIPSVIIIFGVFLFPSLQNNKSISLLMIVLSVIFSVVAFWKLGLIASERQKLIAFAVRYGR
jgi:O-antigen/teichoic acid export membrane protein